MIERKRARKITTERKEMPSLKEQEKPDWKTKTKDAATKIRKRQKRNQKNLEMSRKMATGRERRTEYAAITNTFSIETFWPGKKSNLLRSQSLEGKL